MQQRILALALAGLLGAAPASLHTHGQQPKQNPPAKDEAARKAEEAETALERAVQAAGNDRAALVRQLEDYLRRFPDAPRKVNVYRALLEASQQLHDYPRALDYAERLIAVSPDDSQMMMLAAGLLERQGDDHSLTRAIGYVSRVLDRVEKATPEDKPARESLAEWQQNQTQIRSAVHQVRGQLEMEQKRYDAAAKDLGTSYDLLPNSTAALRLGEIAELQKNCTRAIPRYEAAFLLPESGPSGSVDRREVRQKLGNCWRILHGNEAGLGEDLLAAYDRLGTADKSAAKGRPQARNKNAKEPFAFVLRRVDGTDFPLAPLKGNVVVLNFWATWCGPCREIEPLFDQVAQDFREKPDVAFFSVNTDEDESRVQPYLARQKIAAPVVLADGLDAFLDVNAIPTVMVLDRSGKIIYRASGFGPGDFVGALTATIQQALGPAK
jgi:thiol-disulfide isomerase/thioredoxin